MSHIHGNFQTVCTQNPPGMCAMKPQASKFLVAAGLTLLIFLDVADGECMYGKKKCADCTISKRGVTFCGGFDKGACHLRCCNTIATRAWTCVVQPHAGWCLGPEGYGPDLPSPCSAGCHWTEICYHLQPGSEAEIQCALEGEKLSVACRKCISGVWEELSTCHVNCTE